MKMNYNMIQILQDRPNSSKDHRVECKNRMIECGGLIFPTSQMSAANFTFLIESSSCSGYFSICSINAHVCENVNNINMISPPVRLLKSLPPASIGHWPCGWLLLAGTSGGDAVASWASVPSVWASDETQVTDAVNTKVGILNSLHYRCCPC